MPGLAEVAAAARSGGLDVFGAFHPGPGDATPPGTGTLVLLGPDAPGFWQRFTASAEYLDGQAHPLDRWSRRVIGTLAETVGAEALFPFGDPPYLPFQRWAARSGRAWPSPVGLLVHDRAGLMVSYRGALALPARLNLPDPPPCPCDSCAGRPCLTACPVAALTASGYDLDRCHGYLDTAPGRRDCMAGGCAVRRSCPASRAHGRDPDQSAFHMRAFHR